MLQCGLLKVKSFSFFFKDSCSLTFLRNMEPRKIAVVRRIRSFARNVSLSVTQCLSGLSKRRLTFKTKAFCVLCAWRSDTGAGFIQAWPLSPLPNLPVKLLRTLLALGDGTMRPAQEAMPRDPDSGSDSGIRNSCPQSLANFPSGQLCYTPSQPTGSFPRRISQRLSII